MKGRSVHEEYGVKRRGVIIRNMNQNEDYE